MPNTQLVNANIDANPINNQRAIPAMGPDTQLILDFSDYVPNKVVLSLNSLSIIMTLLQKTTPPGLSKAT
jgi:hypothetical protein